MKRRSLSAILRLRKLDRDAAQASVAMALAAEAAASDAFARAGQAIANEFDFVRQTEMRPPEAAALSDWLPRGRAIAEARCAVEAQAIICGQDSRERLVEAQVGVAAVEALEAARFRARLEGSRKMENAALQEASLRRR